uniref:Uncharacterized protein n=1 Tax=Corethron hystrix TaxID=216773 RepID=A0A7S1BNB2_9STRA|mmetsp:Transcript_33270/g.76784  ORF Transcript_33270/g.76784 Transcript_33270/m.76784 type:complete len:194 (+) Transcript_33270:287-868(+)
MSITTKCKAVIFTGFLIGFITVLCIGNYFRARRAQERQRQRRLAKMGANTDTEQQAGDVQNNYGYCAGNSDDARGSSTAVSSANDFGRNSQSSNNTDSTGMQFHDEHRVNGSFDGRYHYGPNGEMMKPLVDNIPGGALDASAGNTNVGLRRHHNKGGSVVTSSGWGQQRQYTNYRHPHDGSNGSGPGSDLLSV